MFEMITLREWESAADHPMAWTLTEVVSSNLLWVLPDHLLPADLREERPNDSAPMTARLITDKPTGRFTEAMQRFVYALNKDLPADKFAPMMDAFIPGTEGKVRDNNNYITGALTGSDPAYPFNLTFGGNVVKKILEEPILKNGVLAYSIASINIGTLPDPSTLPVYLKQHLTYWSRGNIIPFPQNNGNPCFSALLSAPDSPLFIDVRRVRAVSIIPDPYG